jgi:hypothetical protein
MNGANAGIANRKITNFENRMVKGVASSAGQDKSERGGMGKGHDEAKFDGR